MYVRVHLHTGDHASGGLFPHLKYFSTPLLSLVASPLSGWSSCYFSFQRLGFYLNRPSGFWVRISVLKYCFRAPAWLPPVDPKDFCNQIPVWIDWVCPEEWLDTNLCVFCLQRLDSCVRHTWWCGTGCWTVYPSTNVRIWTPTWYRISPMTIASHRPQWLV